MDLFKNILCVAGVMSVTILLAVLLIIIWDKIKTGIRHMKYNYKVKHRFDEEPTAKCWCRDCYWHGKNGRCNLGGMTRHTPDNGFCYSAEQRKEEDKYYFA